MNDFEMRFGGIGRLMSPDGLQKLRRSHVCVVGIGGVGSWAVEALARSGIGELTLIDLDEVCVSNVNRQLHALDGEVGKAKVEVMANRVRAIHPESAVHPLQTFFTPSNAQEILAAKFDYVLDAIDSPARKCELIAQCRSRGIPIVTTGAAGGRRDPTAIRVVDLAFSAHDRLLQEVRKRLRQRHGFPRRAPFDVDCVYSPEPVVYPNKHGGNCARPAKSSELKLDCNSGYGTAAFVTGTFGFVAAALIVRKLTGNWQPPAQSDSP
jgi:tRNA threonylcarbamoyladenosine dehydratase